MKILIASLILVSSLSSFAQNEKYVGKSVFEGGECSISYDREQMTLTNLVVDGENKVWEILSENGDGYGPDSYVSVNLFDSLQNSSLELSKTLTGNWKASASVGNPEVPMLKGQVKLKLKGESVDSPSSFSFVVKYKAGILKLAENDYNCVELKKVN